MRAGVDGIQGPFADRLWQMLCPRTYKSTGRLTGSPARFPYVKERATQALFEEGEWLQRRKLLCNTDRFIRRHFDAAPIDSYRAMEINRNATPIA
jgi:hypothetical protein